MLFTSCVIISLIFTRFLGSCSKNEKNPEASVINDLIDNQLIALNALHTRNEQGLLSLSARKINDSDFSRGVILGANSLFRIGDSYLIRNTTDLSDHYDITLSFRLLLIAFSSIRVKDFEGSAYLRIRDNAMKIRFSVLQEVCQVQLEDFKFTKMDDVGIEASSEISQAALEKLRSLCLYHINLTLDEMRSEVLTHLVALCW